MWVVFFATLSELALLRYLSGDDSDDKRFDLLFEAYKTDIDILWNKFKKYRTDLILS